MAQIDVGIPSWTNIEVSIDVSDYLSEIEVDMDASDVVSQFPVDEILAEVDEDDICSYINSIHESFDFSDLSDEAVEEAIHSREGLVKVALLNRLADDLAHEPTAWDHARAFLDASPPFDLVKAVVRHLLAKHGATQERWSVAVGAAIGEQLAMEPMPSLYPPAPAEEETENTATAAK
jgi:hypothetical protein